MPKLRIHIILLITIVVLGIALIFQHFIFGSQITTPLIEEISNFPGVVQADLVRVYGSNLRLDLKLEPRIDVNEIYPVIKETAKRKLGNRLEQVLILDTRQESPDLQEAFYKIHFSIEEAIVTGGFTQLAEEITEVARISGLSYYRVNIDADNVYLYLEKDSAYLYQVVPRGGDMLETKGGKTLWFGR